MFKHKLQNGDRNLCGQKIKALRQSMLPKVSQRKLSEMVQLYGVDIDKSAIKRIENGERYVTDIELRIFSKLFDVSSDFLISE